MQRISIRPFARTVPHAQINSRVSEATALLTEAFLEAFHPEVRLTAVAGIANACRV